ncbi:hypothetical protein PsAD13_01594 [Pseudovibrio sp. Ad13]|uniref:hypothetical protein n=1 Tax=Pseudovibrio sp. Ad13 TaxID=989396 RepID=UPI0007AEC43E|nr:hypothetical protein [Pseudovibrio sp. Ad13]KZK85060.1 hypothetical protein PsAD13_01594 [Pseudovibrio sp. Ad13]
MSPQTLNKQEHKWASDMARHLNLNFVEEVNAPIDPGEELAALEKTAEYLFANTDLVKHQSAVFLSFKKAGQSARSGIASAKKDFKGRKTQNAQARITKVKENIASMEQLITVAKSNQIGLEAQLPWVKEDLAQLALELPIVDSLAIAKKIPSKKHKKFLSLDQEASGLISEAETLCANFQVDAANKILKKLNKTLQSYQKEVDWLHALPEVTGVGASENPHVSKLDKLAAAFMRKKTQEHKVELVKAEPDEKTKAFLETWNRENFSDPSERLDLQKRGGCKAPFKFIVRTGSMDDFINQKGCFSAQGAEYLENKDAICTSVVTDEKCFVYGAFGVILDVPPQNVLVSSPDDLMSELNIGRKDKKDRMVNVTQEQNEKLLDVPDHVRNGYLKNELDRYQYDKRQQNVDDLMDNTYYAHNEVIVSSKDGIQHKQGVDATEPVKINGIFLIDAEPSPDTIAFQEFEGKKALTKEEKYQIFMEHAEKVAKNLGVPILFLDGESTMA